MEAIAGAARLSAAISAVREAAPVPQPEASAPETPSKPAPVTDGYIPEEERTPSGLYWVGKDENGAPKVYFDDPEGKPAETCTTNTDKVDRELERLRQKEEELEQQLNAEADPSKAQALEQRLASIRAELAQKDNDAYRRQNAAIS